MSSYCRWGYNNWGLQEIFHDKPFESTATKNWGQQPEGTKVTGASNKLFLKGEMPSTNATCLDLFKVFFLLFTVVNHYQTTIWEHMFGFFQAFYEQTQAWTPSIGVKEPTPFVRIAVGEFAVC